MAAAEAVELEVAQRVKYARGILRLDFPEVRTRAADTLSRFWDATSCSCLFILPIALCTLTR